MKTIYLAAITLTLLVSANVATAQNYNDAGRSSFTDSARVTASYPRTEIVNTPRQECHNEYRQVDRPMSNTNSERGMMGPLIGGLAGGLLGAQVGGGNGSKVAAVAGALAGAAVGDHVQNNSNQNSGRYESREEQHEVCNTVQTSQSRTTGYDMTYSYQGRTYNTISAMPHNSGERVPVRVTVEIINER
jgi:uncharacterized protein YcfJ